MFLTRDPFENIGSRLLLLAEFGDVHPRGLHYMPLIGNLLYDLYCDADEVNQSSILSASNWKLQADLFATV